MGAVQALSGTVTREDRAPVELFTLPGGSTLLAILVTTDDIADAESGGHISIGVAGAYDGPSYFVLQHPVTGPVHGQRQALPSARRLGPIGPDPLPVTAVYSEERPSTQGGPWTVTALFT